MPKYQNDTSKQVVIQSVDGIIVFQPGEVKTTICHIQDSVLTKTSDFPFYNPNASAPVNVALTAAAATKTITGITKAAPGVVTATAHGLSNDDYAYFSVAGMVELHDKIYQVTVLSVDTLKLKTLDAAGAAAYLDTTAYSAFSSGNLRKVVPVSVAIASSAHTLQVCKIPYGSTVRIHYQSVNNKPHIADATSDYDWKQSGVQGKITTLIVSEIAGGTTPTCSVRQEV